MGSDADAIEERLRALWVALGGVGVPQRIVLTGNPWAKLRPRHTKTGKAYQDPTDREAEAQTRAALVAAAPTLRDSNVAVIAAFVRSSRHTIDADNMMKHLLDSAHNVLFFNDNQVTGSANIVELDREEPRTVLLVGPHASTLSRKRAAVKPKQPVLPPSDGKGAQRLRELTAEVEAHGKTHSLQTAELRARVPARGKVVPTLVSYAQRKAIMDAMDAGETAAVVARRYNVSASFVYKVRRMQVKGAGNA